MTYDRTKTLETYRQIWTYEDRNGDLQYEYYCTWSDGSEGRSCSLPWGRMDGAIQLPTTSEKEIREEQQAAIAANLAATDVALAQIKATHAETASLWDAVYPGANLQQVA